VIRPTFIYFIQAASGPIKIGASRTPELRCKEFQVGHYEDLRLLGYLPGRGYDESRLHWKFRALRMPRAHTEWFWPGATLTAFIRQVVDAQQFPEWPLDQWIDQEDAA
jgi:hypothetical protein